MVIRTVAQTMLLVPYALNLSGASLSKCLQQHMPREASVHLGVLEGPLKAVIRVCLCNEVFIAQVKNVGTFRSSRYKFKACAFAVMMGGTMTCACIYAI